MKIVGIIVEYNPLHNGHLYHIEQIRSLSNPDLIIACMSSSVTMRGDLSIFNKFEKTKQVLENHVDLVIELPVVYALNSADTFSDYAVKILNAFKCDEIWCGSEDNDLEKLSMYSNIFKSDEYNLKVKEYLSLGYSYKKSSDLALTSLSLNPLSANDTLALMYYNSIKKYNFKIELRTIKRVGDSFDANEINDSKYTSAKALRSNSDKIPFYCPDAVLASYKRLGLIDMEKIFDYLKYKIMSSTKDELKNIFLIEEGFENSLYEIKDCKTLNEFISKLSTKRYTNSRVKRSLLYVLFNVTKDDIKNIRESKLSLRVLGFNSQGRLYLNSLKKDIEYYTNIKNDINPVLDIELKISKILDIIYNQNLITLEQKGPIYFKEK